MTTTDTGEQSALAVLRNFLAAEGPTLNERLPAERDLCRVLGLSRSRLRKGLAVLEAEGQVWRHVGRGTFVGPRPIPNLSDVELLTSLTSPTAVMEARMSIEPQLARLASLHGTEADFTELRQCNRRCRASKGWRFYEAWDNNFHQAIAAATQNKLLISLFDTLNAVRRSVVWGQLRLTEVPPTDHDSFEEHDAIHAAIAGRDPDLAAEHMRTHLKSVRDRILSTAD
jgi:DNA-binding FadR family transcriptional regulator